ncbi:MAG: methyltransferase family protein [Acidiferrobacterales bacterium]
MFKSRQIPVLVRDGWWVLAQLPLVALAYFLPVWFGAVAQTFLERSVRLVGIALVLVSVPIVLAAVVALGRHLTPFPRPTEHARLRDHGVYGLVRHPLYSGLILAAAGWSIGSLSWAGVAFAVFLGLFFDRKASYEEYWLGRKFVAYPDYRKRVRKLIPWIY